MNDSIDLNASLEAARSRRVATQQAVVDQQREQRSETVGDLLFEVQDLMSSDHDHETVMSRLTAARTGISGGSVPVVSTSTGSSDETLDLSGLSDDQRAIINIVINEPRRLKINEFGGVRDVKYTRLRKDHEAQTSARATGSDATDTTSDMGEEAGDEGPDSETTQLVTDEPSGEKSQVVAPEPTTEQPQRRTVKSAFMGGVLDKLAPKQQ